MLLSKPVSTRSGSCAKVDIIDQHWWALRFLESRPFSSGKRKMSFVRSCPAASRSSPAAMKCASGSAWRKGPGGGRRHGGAGGTQFGHTRASGQRSRRSRTRAVKAAFAEVDVTERGILPRADRRHRRDATVKPEHSGQQRRHEHPQGAGYPQARGVECRDGYQSAPAPSCARTQPTHAMKKAGGGKIINIGSMIDDFRGTILAGSVRGEQGRHRAAFARCASGAIAWAKRQHPGSN